ncbi:MAG: cupin [Actinobacteria bacterium]|jgi:quercetin dioxygenase-like cupin family protein|nr:MAG: cupin [Actinomycetota bacterium]
MVRMIAGPSEVVAAGDPPKRIEEFVGSASTGTAGISIALMRSPAGWTEPGQTPEFIEYSLVLKGVLRVKTRDSAYDVHAGQAIMVESGEWVQYSTPLPEGAEYVSVCVPAFSLETVHRDG